MEIWFGIGDHEIQMDMRGTGLTLALPKPGVLNYGDEQIQPSGEDEGTWEFDLSPRDRGEFCDTFRSWEYLATFLWEDPDTQETIACELKLALCREEGENDWGVCIYPEGSSGTILVLPGEVSESLEEVYATLPPAGWSRVPYVIEGGLKEG